MKIRNINGTSQKTCKCGSWLKHWETFSRQTASSCGVITCIEKDLEGAHVQKGDSDDQKWYIYPLCGEHNAARGQTLDVSILYELVSANVSETCG